jgi:histidinol-phosphate/aromatic aminotransferase/cobyric acid decarboxylase-like protein
MRRALRPATHGGPQGPDSPPIDFSACANAYGPAPIVRDAIASARVDHYPDPTSTATRLAASARWNRPIDELAFGAGSVELLYATMLAVISRGDTVLIPRPAFGEYGRAALLAGARIARPRRLPLSSPPDTIVSAFIEAINATHPRVAVLATPTSPDGTLLTATHVRAVAAICARTQTLLVLDQAYDAFVAHPLGTPVHPAVLHLRSITKEHALPGLRVGFAIGPAPLISAIESCRPPWMASTIAQAAAIAALSAAAESHVTHTVARLRDASLALATWCRDHGIPTIPSATHYQLVQLGNAHALRAIGIAVRDCTSFGLPHYVRIAARTEPEMTTLRAAILQVRHQ